MSFPYFVAALASVIASALLFNALTNSIVGEAMGLQRLKRFLQEKGWRLRIDIAVRIIIFVVVTFAVDTSTVMGEVLSGALVGLVIGFGVIVKPGDTEK